MAEIHEWRVSRLGSGARETFTRVMHVLTFMLEQEHERGRVSKGVIIQASCS